MAYESNPIRRQKVRYNSATARDNTVTFQLDKDGDKVTPASATITIYAPGNSTALVSAASMTVSGTLLTYTVDTTTTASWPVDEGYRAEVAVTVGGVVENAHFIFDVAKFILRTGVTKDQLVALDDSITGMRHDTDEDFSELIEACRDELQLRLESQVLEDGGLVETMIIDRTKVAVPFRMMCLAQIFRNKGDEDRAEYYENKFEKMLRSVLSTLKYDKDQDGEEDTKIGGLQSIRLVT